jgi:ligand-binding sensor domain-containing protein
MKLTRLTSCFIFLLFCSTALLSGCKEKNTDYPPRVWSEYSYTTSTIPYRDISTILYENDHSIWLGAKGKEGLLYNDGYNWSVFDSKNTGFDFDSITSIVRDGNAKLWVGWKSGLANYNEGKWMKINLFDGLCVTSVIVDGIGTIKVGIKGQNGGLATYTDNEWEFFNSSNSDIPSESINSIVSDKDQVLWIATSNTGVFTLKNSSWKKMSTDIPLLSQDFKCIAKAVDGSIWAGSAKSQLIHFFDTTYTVLNTGVSKPINSVLDIGNGDMWCATLGAGLIKFDGSNWESFTMENAALPSNEILCMASGGSGNLFFSVPGGKVLIIKQ